MKKEMKIVLPFYKIAFYTGYKGSKEGHKYFAASSLLCMIMAIYTGHKMISGKSRKKKEVSVESVED